MTDYKEALGKLGLEAKLVKTALKSEAVCKAVLDLTKSVGIESCDGAIGKLLYDLAIKGTNKADIPKNGKLVAQAIVDKKIDKVRFATALKLALSGNDGDLTQAKLEKECGVGVEVTEKDLADAMAAMIKSNEAALKEDRYRFPIGKLLKPVTEKLKWVDGGAVKKEADKQILALLGPKTEEDKKPAPKKKKPAKKEETKKAVKRGGQVGTGDGDVEEAWMFPAPSANLANNRKDILAKHLKETEGKVITRFPPEPNGYLHIGHAKAMHLDFGYGEKMGKCILRYDDTNPEAESQEYIDSILASVHWLGHKPAEVTYSSDYFDKLYALAIELIHRGKAYVCHQNSEDTKEYRQLKKDSPFRNRSVAENLREFEKMKNGLYAEGEAWLRMKIDMQHDNTAMRDPCAYRIKYHHHPRTGDKWCIYPGYDFVHCIVDSLENVTHSLCTLEFDIRREAYYWLLDALELYKPLVWEFSRLQFEDKVVLDDNKTYKVTTMLSKRKLLALVNTGVARGWNDPRMPTLDGLRRRGFTPESINNLCEDIGVTRGIQRIPFRRLERSLRQDLEVRAPRRFGVLRPLKVVITNFDDIKLRECTLRNHPTDDAMGTRVLPFTKVVYIERSDFRMEDDKDYYGLAPGKDVGLRYACNIKCTNVVTTADGTIEELHAECDPERKVKTKGHLHWLPDPEGGHSRYAEVRLYEWLFHSVTLADDKKAAEEEAAARAGATEDEGDDEAAPAVAASKNAHEPLVSEEVLSKALVERSIDMVPGVHYQFERLGYFVCDNDTDEVTGKLVLNRTTLLKESKGKRALK